MVDPHTGEEVYCLIHAEPPGDCISAGTGVRVVGITPTGRTTVMALQMNRPLALAIREEEAQRGRHPPKRIDKGLC
jgi:hypothetical protein